MHFFQSDFFSSISAVRFIHISVCSSSLSLDAIPVYMWTGISSCWCWSTSVMISLFSITSKCLLPPIDDCCGVKFYILSHIHKHINHISGNCSFLCCFVPVLGPVSWYICNYLNTPTFICKKQGRPLMYVIFLKRICYSFWQTFKMGGNHSSPSNVSCDFRV